MRDSKGTVYIHCCYGAGAGTTDGLWVTAQDHRVLVLCESESRSVVSNSL